MESIRLYTENFLDQVCLFEPSNPPTWGEETINSMEGKLALKSKDKCIIACSKLPDCNTEECIKKCSECVDFNKCEWITPQACDFKPLGNTIYSCTDKCVDDTKGIEACGGNDFEKRYKVCKRVCTTCTNPETCTWNSSKSIRPGICNFKPWGPSKQSCVDRCVSEDKQLWGGSDCSLDACNDICENCVNDTLCKWVELPEVSVYEEDYYNLISSDDTPPSQYIRVIPSNEKIIVQWKTNQHQNVNELINEKDGNSEYKIIGYIIQYYKTYNDLEGVITKRISNSDQLKGVSLSVNKNDDDDFSSKNNTYILNDLDNGENYTISITAINMFGVGEPSNTESATPNSNIELSFN